MESDRNLDTYSGFSDDEYLILRAFPLAMIDISD